ncbi:PREDICTED: DNA replication licensing factor mcm4-like [Papilio xuthus]|uniref:DNA replication licensing factor mcm4-like n=1 Tax=Papilio xuthus TaxID=66420 RepID=A0AAJ7E4L0_PAPXU|nr:PREDICTED: DNA replication licensing factor mcm4-like [Papilio xuthus]
MCHAPQKWTESLPWVLLGVRSSFKEDLNASSAELLYGEPLRLPGEFFDPDLASTDHVFLREDAVRASLQPAYTGPHKVMSRSDKSFTLLINGKEVTVSIDRLKPALHREALKQSATDPASGRIDVGILTTGLGAAARRRRADLVAALRELIKPYSKPHTITHAKLLQDVNAASQLMVSREQLDEALRDLQDEGKVTVVSHTHIRLC